MTKAICAIISIAALEAIALITHTDGVLFAAAVAAIAGLGGFNIAKYIYTKGEKNDTGKSD